MLQIYMKHIYRFKLVSFFSCEISTHNVLTSDKSLLVKKKNKNKNHSVSYCNSMNFSSIIFEFVRIDVNFAVICSISSYLSTK